MSAIAPDGSKRDLPRGGRCVAGRIARKYLSSSCDNEDVARRTRLLVGLAGVSVFGLTYDQLGAALRIDPGHLCRGIKSMLPDLRIAAEALGVTLDTLFPKPRARRRAAADDAAGEAGPETEAA